MKCIMACRLHMGKIYSRLECQSTVQRGYALTANSLGEMKSHCVLIPHCSPVIQSCSQLPQEFTRIFNFSYHAVETVKLMLNVALYNIIYHRNNYSRTTYSNLSQVRNAWYWIEALLDWGTNTALNCNWVTNLNCRLGQVTNLLLNLS